MLNDKEILDERICDIEGGENTRTYMEFINESSESFYGRVYTKEELNLLTDKQLTELVEHLDYLWTK